jgi:hypothetical protein
MAEQHHAFGPASRKRRPIRHLWFLFLAPNYSAMGMACQRKTLRLGIRSVQKVNGSYADIEARAISYFR